MIQGIRARLTYANVMATLAVFGVLAGGTAWALSAGSVGSREIKNGGVKLKDLGDIKFKTKKATPSASNPDPEVAQNNAKKIVLYKRGAFTVYGKCFFDTDGDVVYAEMYARTRKNGSLFSAYEGDVLLGGTDDFLNRTTDEDDREIETRDASASDFAEDSHENEVNLLAPGSNRLVLGNAMTYATNGPLTGGDGAWGTGNRCIFGFEAIG
jgi:hypothetical protein